MFPFLKTIGSLKKANLFGLMISCAVLGFVVAFSGAVTLTWLAAHMINIDIGWLDTLVNWVVGIITGIGGWFMLPALIILIAGIFQEKTIYRVESVYYPEAMLTEGPRLWPDLVHDIRFTIWAIFLNLLVLPFYLFGIGFFISIALNTYLLGREFFESAAGYHLGKPEAKQLGRNNKTTVYGGGLIITLMTLVPIINLFVPIIAIVWMVHVYHGLKNRIADSNDEAISLNFPETCLGCYKNKTGDFIIEIIHIGNINDLLMPKNLYCVEIPACQSCFKKHRRLVVAQMIFQVATIIGITSALYCGFTIGMPEAKKYIPLLCTIFGIGVWGTAAVVISRRFFFKTRLLMPNEKGIELKITDQKCLDDFMQLKKIEPIDEFANND